MWIDVHTHLNFLEISPEEALTRAKASGVDRVITIGTEPSDHPVVLALAKKYFPQVACTLGIHPHEATLFTPEVEAFIRQHATEPWVVAVGEIGLDYYYNQSPQEIQKAAFKRQLEIALELGLPVEIHTRDAEADTIEILKQFDGRVRGILHCFTGSQWLADEALALGIDISISGVVTFKNAESLRATVKTVPLDRLHVETDAPFLAPVPHRGKKNLPEFVSHTAQVVADLKGVDLATLSAAVGRNALRTFPKLESTLRQP